MNPVEILTVKNKLALYKNGEPANSIELIELEEVGFKIVSQKDLYEVGDKAVYIQPDYSLSDIPLFESFIRPGGQESKSMLGKVGGEPRRIRAKKFTFSVEGSTDPVYSNGILLTVIDVEAYLNESIFGIEDTLTEKLGITKYEEPEKSSGSGLNVNGGRVFPEGLYKTDEENINNLWNHIEKKIQYPVVLIGTEKIDGSSITIGIKQGEGFICSRNLQKPLKIRKVVGKRKKSLLEKIMFWKKPDLNIYNLIENDDDFVKYGKPYLDLLIQRGYDNIALRGELNGGSLKGSGNKNNPASKESAHIKFFGFDVMNPETGQYEKADYFKFSAIVDIELNTQVAKPAFKAKKVFHKTFNSREELEAECNAYFKSNMIEGIVVRTLDSKFSAKFMNLEYDSKK